MNLLPSHFSYLTETVKIEKQMIARERDIIHYQLFSGFGTTSLCIRRFRWKCKQGIEWK